MGLSLSCEKHLESGEEKKKLPHNYEAIMKDADKSCTENLNTGVYLNAKRKKYRVDMSGYNCFMLFARDLVINWGDDQRFWQWFCLEEATCDAEVEVAQLLGLSWFQIDGRFEMSYLSPGVVYEVVLVVMLKDTAYGWDIPVTLGLSCPDIGIIEHEERLEDKKRGEWIQLLIGELPTSRVHQGEVHFYLLGYKGGRWKGGLILKGAIVRPKN